MVEKAESIILENASVKNGSDVNSIKNATMMEMGKPSERMLIWGAALEISPVPREIRKRVPNIGMAMISASKNSRESPETIMPTT